MKKMYSRFKNALIKTFTIWFLAWLILLKVYDVDQFWVKVFIVSRIVLFVTDVLLSYLIDLQLILGRKAQQLKRRNENNPTR